MSNGLSDISIKYLFGARNTPTYFTLLSTFLLKLVSLPDSL